MDPELQKKIDAARAEGYSDEEIQDHLQRQQGRQQVIEQAQQSQTIPAPEIAPYSMDRSQEQLGTIGLGVAQYAAPVAAAAAAALGGNKIYNAWKNGTQAAQELARAKLASEEGIMERAAAKAAGRVPGAAPGPVAPNTAVSSIVDASGRPMTYTASTPTTASTPATATAQAMPKSVAPTNLIDKTTQMVRQLAANKLLQNAVKFGNVAGLALHSGDLGPPVPQSGPYRGMELNPNTGRPWTRQELEALR